MIKFRAWDNECKVIREYDELKGLTLDALDASNFKLEQFTGLTDMNGKDIYEGDIIKYTSEDGAFFYAEVKYFADDNYPAFDFIPPDEDWHFQSNCLSEGTFSNALEVVGNVHANPELLEEDK